MSRALPDTFTASNFFHLCHVTRPEYTLTAESDRSQCVRRACFITLLSDPCHDLCLLDFFGIGRTEFLKAVQERDPSRHDIFS
jgi:hypothetical protein